MSCFCWVHGTGKNNSLIQLDRCFPVTAALFTAVPTVFVRLSSSPENTGPHPGALFPPGRPFLVCQVICCLPFCFSPASFCPRVTALATKRKGSATAAAACAKCAGVPNTRAPDRPERLYPLHLNCRTRSSSHVTGARPDRRNLSDCSLWLSGLLTFSPSSTA